MVSQNLCINHGLFLYLSSILEVIPSLRPVKERSLRRLIQGEEIRVGFMEEVAFTP